MAANGEAATSGSGVMAYQRGSVWQHRRASSGGAASAAAAWRQHQHQRHQWHHIMA